MRSFDENIFDGRWSRDIVTLLEMDEVAPDRFRNRHNQPNAYRALFGGQIVAQALQAADRTTPGRTVHSLHCYFLRAGSAASPIDYAVERTRDGGRFSTRRVVARQDDQIIFTMECSYRTPIAGFSHQRAMSVPFDPENALDESAFDAVIGAENQRYAALFKGHYPIEVRMPGPCRLCRDRGGRQTPLLVARAGGGAGRRSGDASPDFHISVGFSVRRRPAGATHGRIARPASVRREPRSLHLVSSRYAVRRLAAV